MSLHLSNGTVFSQRYRVERRIASGGMGDVYEAVHVETNRRLALKVLHKTLLKNDEQRSRFRKEARLAAAVESEYIVDVFDAGIDADTQLPFLVMELLRGEDLGVRIERTGALSAEETVVVLSQVALALDKTHQAAIVHRDLKPDNIFLKEQKNKTYSVKLLDFGVAKIIADEHQKTHGGQTTGAIGTPLYMAPEQFAIGGVVSPATDVYALGLVAFDMLVGKPYWEYEALNTPIAIAFAVKVARGPVEPASTRAARYTNVRLPEAFDAWFVRATAVEAKERFATAGEAVLELANALNVPVPTALLTSTTVMQRIAPGAEVAPSLEERTQVYVETKPAALPARARAPSRIPWVLVAGLLILLSLGVGTWFSRSGVDHADAVPSAVPARSQEPTVLPVLGVASTGSSSAATASTVDMMPSSEAVAEEIPKTATKVSTGKPSGTSRTKQKDRRKHWSND